MGEVGRITHEMANATCTLYTTEKRMEVLARRRAGRGLDEPATRIGVA